MEALNSENSGTRQNQQDKERGNLERMFADLKLELVAKGYENLQVERHDEPNGFFLTQRTIGSGFKAWFSKEEESLLLSVSQVGGSYLIAHVVSPEIGKIAREHLERYRKEQGLTDVHYH